MTRRRRVPQTDDLRGMQITTQVARTIDLAERAQQAVLIQKAIGEVVAGLLANGVPLLIGVSDGYLPTSEPDTQNIGVAIYWEPVDDPRMPIQRTLTFPYRCLDCGDWGMGEHLCQQRRSPAPEDVDAEPSETLQ